MTYNEAMKMVERFCELAEQNESLHYSYGFLQSFAAQCLSGRDIDHSLRVLKLATNELAASGSLVEEQSIINK